MMKQDRMRLITKYKNKLIAANKARDYGSAKEAAKVLKSLLNGGTMGSNHGPNSETRNLNQESSAQYSNRDVSSSKGRSSLNNQAMDFDKYDYKGEEQPWTDDGFSGISVVDAGMDSETPADFGSLQNARRMVEQVPNMSEAKALELSKVGNSGFALENRDRSLSALQKRNYGRGFGSVERMNVDDTDNGNFSNDVIRSLQKTDKVLAKKIGQLQADFTNHMDDHHSGVDSVENQVSDFTLEHNNKAARFDSNSSADYNNDGTTDQWGDSLLYPEFHNDGVIDVGEVRLATNMDFVPRNKTKSFSQIIKEMPPKSNVKVKTTATNTVVNNVLSQIKGLLFRK